MKGRKKPRMAFLFCAFQRCVIKKIRAIFVTNQVQNLRLDHARFPALWAVCLTYSEFSFAPWDYFSLVFAFQRYSVEKCSKLSLMFTFPYIQAGCEVPLDPGIPAASIEHQLVVVETEEQLTGRDYCSRFFCL